MTEDVLVLIDKHFARVIEERQEQHRVAPIRVLVVDDDEAVTASIMAALARCNVLASVANDGLEALHVAEQVGPFDLALIDIKMPGLSGVETMVRLKQTAPQMPVVFITGYPHHEQLDEALKIGYLGLLQKPINLDALVDVCQRHRLDIRPK
jgi:DNA-binding NtrC family response regulator